MMGWAGRGVLAAVIAFATLAAPAQATVRKGTASDRQGDTAAGSHYDIVTTVAQADDSGAAGFGVQLAATPASGMYVVGLLGTTSGTSCGAPYVLFSGIPSSGAAVYGRDTGSDFKPATMKVEGNVVAFAAIDAAQLALPFDCAIAGTSQNAAGTNLYDATDALVPLAADAPPAATPTPAPVATPAPTPVPAPTTATTPPVAVPKAAKLTVALDGAPSTIRRNKAMTLKLRIANDGSRKSSKVTVSLSRPRGLSAARQIKLSALKPGQKRTLKLKVKLTKRARVSTTLKVTARSGKLKATSALLLRIGKAKKIAPQPVTKKSPIVGTYWYRTVNHVDYAWDNRALYFVDGGAVYSGFPPGGLPATCATPPAKPDEEFDMRDGCLPYTFDEKSGAVTIGDKAGTFKDGKLTIDGNAYNPLQIPAAGTHYTINEHQHSSFRGLCGLVLGCTVSQQFLSLSPDGQFVLSRSTTSTMGDPGIGPWSVVGSYPPDQHGTYAVLDRGRIQLTFADGSVKIETFAVEFNHATGALDPVGEGLLIGADNFYPDPSP